MSTSDSTSASRSPRRWWLVVPIVLAVIVALVVWNSTRGSDDTTTSAPSDAPAQGPASSTPEQEGTPGAFIDSTQRSWPSPGSEVDDAQYAEPGSYSVDIAYNRPVLTPVNHDGDLPSNDSLKEGMNKCSEEKILLDGDTTQQYVNARFLAVNEFSGPTKMEKDVPRGYAHSVDGGILAALNQLGYAAPLAGDEVGIETDRELWGSSETISTALKQLPTDSRSMENSRATVLSAPWGYKVVTCSNNVMVVDVLIKEPDNMPESRSEGSYAVKVPLKWEDDDWTPDLSGASADADIKSPRVIEADDVSSYTAVKFS